MLRHLVWLLLCSTAWAGTLDVGPRKRFDSIEAAYRKARPGDVIRVHPLPDGKAYGNFALRVRKYEITFRGVVESA